MVGTIAPFEAMLGPAADDGFVARAAQFLIDRELTRGSSTVHNAEERDTAPSWRQLCFPRFYFYDVLRGLAALVRWAEATGATLPQRAVVGVVDDLVARFPDGVVRIGRRSYEGRTTIAGDRATGTARQPASSFALLEAVSAVGEASEPLTRQWSDARRGLLRLADAGRLVA
jgi:hypothetical protein